MNANINYDEIPDTSAVQEDLLAALSSQHVTVHTNEEPDFDYMENEDVAFVVKNPHNEENLLIELGGEFSVFFGLWHGQYKAVEYDYDRMKKDVAAILAGNAGVLSLYTTWKNCWNAAGKSRSRRRNCWHRVAGWNCSTGTRRRTKALSFRRKDDTFYAKDYYEKAKTARPVGLAVLPWNVKI